MTTVVLIEPEKEENIGRVARVMKNFGFTKLLLISPKCSHLGTKAMALASHADDVLKKAKVGGKDALEGFDCLVGTTAILGTDSNVLRSPLLPREAAPLLAKKKRSIALLFGRESSGLNNEELRQCDLLVTIPTVRNYSTMNLSQAVGIVLYEVFVASGREHAASHIRFARRKDKDILLRQVYSALDPMDFHTPGKKEAQRRVWKRIIGKSFLTKKEFMALMGFFKKIRT
ncbi:TPA: RNA methyltransferase [Candidatus Woesearchaeota archaeon]|nr:MAG: RNA methyltransferase, TrmH family, group 1 [archaeon GW2011_AR11]HIH05100.1 RNA methyltransferase [Candidatus Woesearchaeota archaeon]HIH91283.1 RNA methyltransferase [Candidatus Woesearchaeota archaeon]HII64090.1 RNA methyltransferase [Candidatus Woesearchaeota archaeon]HIJ19264.1 RNA methyltransferase [Candidatus Woesearchaeota archaeon]